MKLTTIMIANKTTALKTPVKRTSINSFLLLELSKNKKKIKKKKGMKQRSYACFTSKHSVVAVHRMLMFD